MTKHRNVLQHASNKAYRSVMPKYALRDNVDKYGAAIKLKIFAGVQQLPLRGVPVIMARWRKVRRANNYKSLAATYWRVCAACAVCRWY